MKSLGLSRDARTEVTATPVEATHASPVPADPDEEGEKEIEMNAGHIRKVLEAALLAADSPLTESRLASLFLDGELPSDDPKAAIRTTLEHIRAENPERGFELVQVASGWRFQIPQNLAPWVGRLWQEPPPRYSRALLETLALIAYRQPATRGDIESVRGVGVSASIMRTLLERGWIRAVGQRDTPGRPTLYGTTRTFLDYFNLRHLDDLPPLDELPGLMDESAAADTFPPVEEALAQAEDDANDPPPQIETLAPAAAG